MAALDSRKYLEAKFSLLFQFYDTDGDGFLSTQDFEHREKMVGQQAGLNEKEIEGYIGKMKPFYSEVIGSNKEQFATKVAEIILRKPRLHEAALRAKSSTLFTLLDRNKNGTLEPREFAFLMHSWLIRERDTVKELFELADRQKEGKLTQDDFYEFQAALRSPTRNRIADIIISHLEKLPDEPIPQGPPPQGSAPPGPTGAGGTGAPASRQNGHAVNPRTAANSSSESQLSTDMAQLHIPRAQPPTKSSTGQSKHKK